MAEHNAPFAHVAYQQPDGTTGVLDNCDEMAIHAVPGAVTAENIADGAVVNGKIAKGAVTSAELADGAVTAENIADGAVGREQLAPEIVESWDSIFRIASGSYKGTCAADSIIGFDVPLDAPDGYRIASITRLSNASAGALVPSDVKVSGAVVSVLLRNTTMMTQPFTLDVQAVCAKAELFA